jgi:peptidoglycan/xylan/chitin deacetylase (PgdA/CDA1 family)
MPLMTLPPGKLLLVAVILFAAAFTQSTKPVEDTTAQAAPSVHPASHPPLTLELSRRTTSTTRKNPRTSDPAEPDWNLSAGKVLYLTFDDGPQPIYTPKVLAVLAKHHAKATFFVLGREVAAHPGLVELERSYGHHVGNHTWDHPMLTHLTDARIRQEISTTGVQSKCFRPPFRDTDARVAAIAASYHLRQVLWDVDTKDWTKPGAAKIERAILRGARPGAIILLHDGGGNRSETVAALDRALTQLAAQGYTFRSLPC